MSISGDSVAGEIFITLDISFEFFCTNRYGMEIVGIWAVGKDCL